MSLIHEALEKVDQEKRGTAPSPAVNAPPEEGKNLSEEKTYLLHWMGGALLFFFVLGLIYLWGHSSFVNSGAPSPSRPPTSLSERERFSLTGITGVGTDLTAVVNNELVRVGGQVNGATVTAIDTQAHQVVLNWNGRSITLSLYGEDRSRLTL